MGGGSGGPAQPFSGPVERCPPGFRVRIPGQGPLLCGRPRGADSRHQVPGQAAEGVFQVWRHPVAALQKLDRAAAEGLRGQSGTVQKGP